MARVDLLGIGTANDCHLDEMSDLVDNFVNDVFSKEDPEAFWKRLCNSPEAQQQYAKCLIYKYIAFIYGLGHKPLKEAIGMIKNITSNPTQSPKTPTENLKVKDNNRASTIELSPMHKRGRTSATSPRRWTSAENRLVQTKRDSLAPADNLNSQHNRIKRKSSENILEDIFTTSQSSDSEYDPDTVTKLRELIYSISFLVNTFDLSRWDFSGLREVFLVWSKARTWNKAATSLEQSIMKRISKPPNVYNIAERKWEHALIDILNSCHCDQDSQSSKSLNHEMVGNSIKYTTLRYKVEKNENTILSYIEAIRSLIEKIYTKIDLSTNQYNEEAKLLSLLQVFCEAIVMAPHVPINLLERAYSTIQALILMPLPVSATATETLDLIHVEMKSPGYFRRKIFFQDHETQADGQTTNNTSLGTPTNVFVDTENGNWNTIEMAFRNLASKCNFISSNEGQQQRLTVEHIFHSVFGSSDCDMSLLRQVLETCPKSRLSQIHGEAMRLTEEAVSMENPISAQEFLKQQLKSLSRVIALGEDDKCPKENLPVIKEGQQQDNKSTFSKASASSKSSPALSSLISPPRIRSHLSRAASEEADSPSRSNRVMAEEEQPNELTAAEKMNYTQIILKTFDNDQLSDAIFELVRATANEFLSEKRRSSSGYVTAQKRYLVKKSSSFLSSEGARDSGLIDDYPEGEKDSPAKSSGKSSGLSPRKSPLTSPDKSPRKSGEMYSGDFWKKFSEKGFSGAKTNGDENLDKLLNSFRYSGLLSDEEKKELESVKRRSGNLLSPNDALARRSKSSVSDLPSMKNNLKLPIEQKYTLTASATLPKDKSSRSKKAKHRFMTLGRKGISMVRGIRRSSSARTPDVISPGDYSFPSEEKDQHIPLFKSHSSKDEKGQEDVKKKSISVSSTPVKSNGFFEGTNVPRWRTTSLPLKESFHEKKKDKSKRGNVMQLFQSSGDVRLESQKDVLPVKRKLSKKKLRRHSSSKQKSTSFAVSKAFSFDALDNDNLNPLNKTNAVSKSHNTLSSNKKLSLDDRIQVFDDDDEVRKRMDSGVTGDKSSDEACSGTPGSAKDGPWENTGVAGVKFARKPGLRRNRKSRSSFSHHFRGSTSRKKVLNLAFVGSDRTVGDMARAYYELRRRQLTRAPLRHHIDLRLYYIPVGGSAFSDEFGSIQSGCTPFDLEISKMLGDVDPWYRSVVTLTANNLRRVFPSINSEDMDDKPVQCSEEAHFNSKPTPDNILANSLLSYFRFAINTCHVPIFKAVLRTSTDELITEVFCCRVEIGHVAYKQAIAAGRFGKLGKLVDLSNDTGPPAAYTQFKYKKYGINGNFVLSKTLEETNYYRVSLIPVALSGSNKDQARFPGADGLQATLVDNEKRLKQIKRGTKVPLQEEICTKSRFTVSEAKIEVVRPVQGTFTVCLDHTLIHTNIKSFEVSRCLAPEYERPNARKRKPTHTAHVMSLPLKTFWPSSNLA